MGNWLCAPNSTFARPLTSALLALVRFPPPLPDVAPAAFTRFATWREVTALETETLASADSSAFAASQASVKAIMLQLPVLAAAEGGGATAMASPVSGTVKIGDDDQT